MLIVISIAKRQRKYKKIVYDIVIQHWKGFLDVFDIFQYALDTFYASVHRWEVYCIANNMVITRPAYNTYIKSNHCKLFSGYFLI